MSDENPYAYNPGNRDAVPRSWEHKSGSTVPSTQEPRTPIMIYLKQGRKPCRITVFETHLIIEAEHLNEPITLDRSEAGTGIKFLQKKLIVRTPESGKKHKFTYQTTPDKDLLCARLDVWANGTPDADPATAYREVEAELVKHCSWYTRSHLLFLGILAIIPMVICVAVAIGASMKTSEFQSNEDRIGFMVVMIFFAFLCFAIAVANFILLYVLNKRIKTGLFWSMICYIPFSLSGGLIPLIVLIYAIVENSNFNQQVKYLEEDNRPPVPYAQAVNPYAPPPGR